MQCPLSSCMLFRKLKTMWCWMEDGKVSKVNEYGSSASILKMYRSSWAHCSNDTNLGREIPAVWFRGSCCPFTVLLWRARVTAYSRYCWGLITVKLLLALVPPERGALASIKTQPPSKMWMHSALKNSLADAIRLVLSAAFGPQTFGQHLAILENAFLWRRIAS